MTSKRIVITYFRCLPGVSLQVCDCRSSCWAPPVVHLEHVRLGARLVRALAALELNERGAARTLQLAVVAQLQVLDCAELREGLTQRCLVRVETQVAHKHGALLDHVQRARDLFRLADLFRYDRGAFDC